MHLMRSLPPARTQNDPRAALGAPNANAERPPFCVRGPPRQRRTPPLLPSPPPVREIGFSSCGLGGVKGRVLFFKM